MEEKLQAHLTTNIPQVLSLGAGGWLDCYSLLWVLAQRRDTRVWEGQLDKKWQAMNTAVAKNKPYSVEMMILNHKVKLRKRQHVSKQKIKKEHKNAVQNKKQE